MFTPHEPANGVYIFMINGTAGVAGEALDKRDALGVTEPGALAIKAAAGAEILIFDLANVQLNQ